MPHVTAHVPEELLSGHEPQLIAHLSEAVTAVYGAWARELVTVVLVGVRATRWGRGGVVDADPAPTVVLGIRQVAFERPDAGELADGLARHLTDAVRSVLGESAGARTYVELVATPPGRSAFGGVLVD